MNQIHSTAIIGPGVELGEDNIVGPHAVLYGPTVLGNGNWIGPHVVIGTPGESKGNPHPPLWDKPGPGPAITIGDDNIIHEFVAIQASLSDQTKIGDRCFIMDKAHVPHDAQLGNDVTVACSVMIGGHSRIGDGANLGLASVLHQFMVVGAGAMIGMNSVVTRPIPPFSIAYGSPARVKGANRVGMSRAGIAPNVVEALHTAFVSEIELDSDVMAPELQAAFDWFNQAVGAH
ncbi:MAG: hypothetical protein M9952_13025 [Microthrixaceae bacterium]|nr:hypothetical protein [Microthrixaceae bacterium]